MSVCFLLLKQNAQDWVIYKEREFNVVQGPPARKSENMAAGSAHFWPGLGCLSSWQEDDRQGSVDGRHKTQSGF